MVGGVINIGHYGAIGLSAIYYLGGNGEFGMSENFLSLCPLSTCGEGSA